MENIETFNRIVGLVLADLYSSFPVPLDLRIAHYAELVGLCEDPEYMDAGEWEPVVAAIDWLHAEGFVRGEGVGCEQAFARHAVLSLRGLQVLSVPSSLQSQESIGTSLTKAAKDGAKQGVAELVKVALFEGGKLVVQAAIQAAIQGS